MFEKAQWANIVKIESQKCINTTFHPGGGSTSTIENIGVDESGQRWRFYFDTGYDANGMGNIGFNYHFTQLP